MSKVKGIEVFVNDESKGVYEINNPTPYLILVEAGVTELLTEYVSSMWIKENSGNTRDVGIREEIPADCEFYITTYKEIKGKRWLSELRQILKPKSN